MLLLIAQGEVSVAQIMEGLAERHRMTRPAIAKHLGLLLRAGLLSESWQGREHVYRMAPGRLGEVTRWVERVEAFEVVGPGPTSVETSARSSDREFEVDPDVARELALERDPAAQTTSKNVRHRPFDGETATALRDGADQVNREWQVW